jgi:hemoglobin
LQYVVAFFSEKESITGFIFNNVAKVNWKKHLPVMYDFWQSIIFDTNSYSGNPMNVHSHLNNLTPLTKKTF